MGTDSVEGNFNSNSDFWDQPYYRLTKNIASLFGLWPYQTTRQVIIHRSIAYFFFLIQFLPQLSAARHYYTDFTLLMDYAEYFLTDMAYVTNIGTCIYMSSKMRILLDRVKEDWLMLTDIYGKHKLEEQGELGRKTIILYVGILYSSSVVVPTEPLQRKFINYILERNNTVPDFFMPMEYPSFVDVHKYHYPLIFLCIISITFNMSLTTLDLFFFLFCHHLFGLFTALGHAIENIPARCDGHNDDEEFEYVKNCIKFHNRAIKFFELLEEIFVGNFIIILGINMVIMSAAAVQVAIQTTSFGDYVRHGVFVGLPLIHLFIICFVAQQVIDYSLEIQMHIEFSQWFQSSLRTQRMLKLMILRSQLSCQLSAGKMIYMSLQTFTMISKASVTYFTVFLTVR